MGGDSCPFSPKRWENINMKFYSKVVNKPHSIVEEVRNGQRVIKRNRICMFKKGVLETDDPKVIAKLESRKDLFRTDRPWTLKSDWKTTKEGKKLLEEGERLNIDCRHIREWYLKELIDKKLHPKKKNVPEPPKENKKELVSDKPPKVSTTKEVKTDYKEMIKLAKEAGIRGYGVKKEILKKKLKESGVNV